MSKRKSGLGKGLDALIPGGAEALPEENAIVEIEITQINPNPRQPRKEFDENELLQLAQSIKEHGIIQPLIISSKQESGNYTLIAGERRLLAAKLAGLNKVPVIIRDASEQDHLELALIENLQRSDLNPIEAAEAYRQLNQEFNLSHEQIASRVGKSRVAITNTLRLLQLPDKVKNALADNRISEGHARALLGLQTQQAQLAALDTIITKQLSVRQTEELVKKLMGRRSQTTQQKASPHIQAIEEQLRRKLGTKVNVKQGKKGGSIIVRYYSQEELDALLDILLGES